MIVITKNHAKTIKHLKSKINTLERYHNLDAGADWILSFLDADHNPYVIVNIQSPEKFKKATKKLKAITTIDPAKPIATMRS